jgi:hypothetical protein
MPDELIVKEVDSVGRPCKYETHVEPYLDQVYEWLKEGKTDYSIAEQLGIAQCTWIRYKDRYDNLASLYTRAIHERNRLVMNRMFKKATGIKESLLKQKVTKDGDVVDITEEVYIPPDVNAADLFLRNNDPDYKGQKASESGNVTINNFQLDDWQTKRKQLLQEIMRLEMQSAVDLEPTEPD